MSEIAGLREEVKQLANRVIPIVKKRSPDPLPPSEISWYFTYILDALISIQLRIEEDT